MENDADAVANLTEEIVTRGEFDSAPRCPRCGASLQINPYDYSQKYCPHGCGYAVRRDGGSALNSEVNDGE